MKINTKINTRVNESVAECRKVLVDATIELLKSIGAETGQDVVFKKMLFLFQHKENTTETIVCDRIMICHEKSAHQYYFVSLDDNKACQTSDMLSLSTLQIIYEEVRNLVRNY